MLFNETNVLPITGWKRASPALDVPLEETAV